MDIKETLKNDLKTALINHDQDKLLVLRYLLSEMKNAEIEKKEVLNEVEMTKLLSKQVKMRKDSIAEFQKADRTDLVSKEQKEIDIIETYLPKMMSEDEMVSLVKETIEANHFQLPSDMGRVIKEVIAKAQGKADGGVVARIVKEKFS